MNDDEDDDDAEERFDARSDDRMGWPAAAVWCSFFIFLSILATQIVSCVKVH